MFNRLGKLTLASTAVLMLFIVNGCIRNSQLDNYPTVHFATEVQPIIAANCTQSGCHNSNGGEVFDLTTYNAIVSQVSPGNGRSSNIYRAITGRTIGNFMPPSPSSPLTEDQIRTIFVWIEQGAPNN